MNALELITKSYGIAGIISPGYEEMDAQQLNDGIFWLNVVTSEKAIRSFAIPYRKADNSFVMENGTEKYSIPDLVSLDSLAFTDESGSLRYDIKLASYDEYFSSTRANNTTGLPSIYFAERKEFGTDLYFYPFPNKEYTINIRGKFVLSRRTLDTIDLEYDYDDFFLGLIAMEVAKKLAIANDETWTPEKDAELNRVRQLVNGMAGSSLSKDRGLGILNSNANPLTMSRGWRP